MAARYTIDPKPFKRHMEFPLPEVEKHPYNFPPLAHISNTIFKMTYVREIQSLSAKKKKKKKAARRAASKTG